MTARSPSGIFSKHLVERPSGDGGEARPRCRLVAYAWDLTTDRLTWGPGATELPELPPLTAFADGASLARAMEADGGFSRAQAIAAAGDADAGHGVPYATRYALRLRADRLVMVDDTGRWHGDARGRPAVAAGLLRLEIDGAGPEALSASVRARAALLARLAEDLREAQQARRSVTLVVGRLDGSDDALGRVCDRLRALMRRRDRLVADGPDRFALLLASCPAGEAQAAVRRVSSLLSAGPDAIEGLRLGAASAAGTGADAPDLLRRAEEALEPAGRPAFADSLRASASPGTTAEEILDALNGRRLDVALAPAVDGASGTMAFATAIPGIADGAGRLAVVGDLGAAAGRAGLADHVDARTLERVCDRLAADRDARIAWRIAPEALRSMRFLSVVAAHLGARPGIESRLIVDVPEEALSESRSRGRLDALKALGVATMLSPFGQGCLSERQLRALPVDVLRIDPRLVQTVGRSPDDRLVLRRLIDKAQHLGMATLADGVPDEAALRLLSGFGADYFQGPAVGPAVRPMRDREGGGRTTRVA